MKSIRRYQIVVLVAGTVAIVAVATSAYYFAIRRSLTREFDAALLARAGAVAALLEYDPPYFEFDFIDQNMPQYCRGPQPEYFQLWVDGAVFEKSPSLASAQLPYAGEATGRPRFANVVLPDGRPGRAVTVELVVSAEDGATPAGVARFGKAVVSAARSREDLRSALATLALMSLVEGVLICACVSVLVLWTIGRAMDRLGDLSDQVDAIDSEKLHHRVREAELPDELRPIAAGLNRLLARLEEGFRRERRITANIAHELRTPVAELRNATDVARRWRDDAALAERTVETAGEIALQMDRIVGSLLRFARLESGQLAFTPVPVDVSRVITDGWESLRPRAQQKGIRQAIDVKPDLVVSTDADGIDLIVANLLSNAVEYCPEGGWIRCTTALDASTLRVELSNTHEGLSAADIPHLAEAFWTKDAARTGSEHAGLGLTLVAAVARLIGADVTYAVNDGAFHASLVVPAQARDNTASRRQISAS